MWQPGQSGNPKGVPKKELRFRAALDRAMAQDDSKRLREAAESLLSSAAKGEPWAIKELADRLDGKPSQIMTLAGDPDSPLIQRVERVIVPVAGTESPLRSPAEKPEAEPSKEPG